ncbi:MAG TPA: hypothetical protein VFP10_06865, partial [Candidatus Eisenbacteria bacterium]|nr:hypothetical protein [Candidatus Eisenbacteria bacterium]
PDLLAGLPGVRVMELTDGQAARLEVDDPERDLPVVARRLVESGLDLLELHEEVSDLETIFRTATGAGHA